MGSHCLATGVWHTPPLILHSEGLRRTMANICEPSKCSARKKRPGGDGGGREVLNTEATLNTGEAVPCVYARLSAARGWVM